MATIKSVIRNLLLLILLTPAFAFAAVPTWEIVPNQSSITFTATQNGAPVTGQFKKFTGEIHFDVNQLNTSNVKITIDMNSVNVGYGEVASTLKTPDWFNVKAFPQAVFQADKFIKTGEDTYQAMGTLTIRDKTIPVTLNFSGKEDDQHIAHLKGSTMLKRTAFGVGQGDWAKTDNIKDDVKVEFILTAVKK